MAPPLGCQDSIIRMELYAKVRYGHPLCNLLGRKFEHTNGQNLDEDFSFWPFWVKNRTKLVLRPFFWSSPNFG